MLLNVSTRQLEEEFYMIDLPGILHKKAQQIAEERLAQLHITLAPNMKEENFEELVRNLSWSLEFLE